MVDALKAAGYAVERIDTPCDLIVAKHGLTHCVEIKLPLGPRGGTKGSVLTPAQKDFANRWGRRGCFHVVRSPEEALQALDTCFRWTVNRWSEGGPNGVPL